MVGVAGSSSEFEVSHLTPKGLELGMHTEVEFLLV